MRARVPRRRHPGLPRQRNRRTLGAVAGPVASSDGVQRRILALLEDLEKKIASPAAGETDLAEAARTIAEATEWANNIKAAMATLLETAGQLIEGQKSGRQDLDTAVAGLKSREDALAAQLKTFGTGMEKLGALLQRLDLRSSELEALKLKLVDYYGRWTDASKTIVEETSTLSKRLDAGDHMVTRLEGLQKGWTEQTATAITENAAAQLAAAEKNRRQCGAARHDGHRVPEGFRHSQRSGTEGGPAGVDAHSALDGTGAGNRPGARRAVVCVCRRAWAERVRRLRPL